MKTLALCLLSLLYLHFTFGQTSDMYKPLAKGDTIPNLELTLCKGDSSFRTHLLDFKGKLLLFDFWATYCLDCVASMPKLLEYQKEFSDKLQIILVTSNTDSQIQNLFHRLSKIDNTKKFVEAGRQLVILKEDSILSQLLPHRSFPMHAWISKDQVLLAVAYGSSTNKELVRDLLAQKPVKFQEQRVVDLDINDPLSWISKDISNPKAVSYYSVLLKHIEYGAGGFAYSRPIVDTNANTTIGITCVNNSIINLYRFAYQNQLNLKPYIPRNRIMINLKNLTRFFPPKDIDKYEAWVDSNTFCYGLLIPPNLSPQIYDIMRNDLDRILGLRTSIQSKKVKCFLLKRIDSVDRIKTIHTQQQFASKGGELFIQNMEMNQLFLNLSSVIEAQFPSNIFLNETRYNQNIDITLPWNKSPKDIEFSQLRKSLRRYGLDIQIGYRMVDMLVIDEKVSD